MEGQNNVEEKSTNEQIVGGSDSSDNEQVKEFEEGGYGWYVLTLLSCENGDAGGVHSNWRLKRVVVATVFLINMHTWGMNSVSWVLPESPRIPKANIIFKAYVRFGG